MPPSSPKFYLTTPIYYVNARPHIGHAYTTIVADVLARRHRLLGDDTFFLTGTDEHGQKIERSAAAAGIPPQQFADQVSASFRQLWDRMGITYNDYIRTTEPRHKQGVQKLFRELQDRGHIYLSTYTGQYCVSDEAYVDGPPGVRCPDCGRVTETVSESNYYFRLSTFQLPLLDLIESNQLLITPDSRRNEVLSFLRGNPALTQSSRADDPSLSADAGAPSSRGPSRKGGVSDEVRPLSVQPSRADKPALAHTAAGTPYLPGALKDLSISRTSFKWGVPVPGDKAHVIYVWLDALANYMTAIGYGSDDPADQEKFARYWPANLHLVGKEIIRFHCVYWPAFLLALNPAYKVEPAADPGAPRLDSETWVSPEPQKPAPPPLSPKQHKAWAEKMLPKAITAHGWLLFEDSKMSKSRGNIVRTETILDAFGVLCPPQPAPHLLSSFAEPGSPASASARRGGEGGGSASPTDPAQRDRDLFATDVLRYFLLREIPFGQDGSFSFDALIQRYNSDLANGYGNLVSRTLKMVVQSRNGRIPEKKNRQNHIVGLIQPKHLDVLDSTKRFSPGTSEVKQLAEAVALQVGADLRISANFHGNLESISKLAQTIDEYISFAKPWELAKRNDDVSGEALDEVLETAARSIRIITALLYPILPFSTAKVWAQLGLGSIEDAARNGELKDLQWGGLQPGTRLGPLSPIFPRADKGLAQIMADTEQNSTPPNLSGVTAQADAQTSETTEFAEAPLSSVGGSTPLAPEATDGAYPGVPAPSRLSNELTSSASAAHLDPTHPAAGPRTSTIAEPHPITQVGGSAAVTTERLGTPSHAEAAASGLFATHASGVPVNAPPADTSPQITIDDFAKVELRVAKILVCERIPKADKLLRLEVDLGPEPGMGRRQILSGIAEWYTPEELLGRKIVVIANLAPRKMRGLESHGMLLAASSGENGKPALATFADSDQIEVGARLK